MSVQDRAGLVGARRVVVKVGSSSISGENLGKIQPIVEALVEAHASGTEVVLVSSRDRVLPGEDAEAAEVLETVFRERAMQVMNGARADTVERQGDEVLVTLTATDRTPSGGTVSRRFGGSWSLVWSPTARRWLLDRAAISAGYACA